MKQKKTLFFGKKNGKKTKKLQILGIINGIQMMFVAS